MDCNLLHTMPGIWKAINNSRQMPQDVNTGLNRKEYGVGVKFSHSGRYWMSRDHLSVGVWDLDMERRPVETHQARPWVPPPRPSCASIKVHEYLEASCVRSMRMTASLTALSAAGVATTGEARVGTQPSRGRAARARLPDVETGCLGTFLTLLAIPSMSEQQAES